MITRKFLQNKGLFKQSVTVDIKPSDTTTGVINIIAQRGNVQAVGFVVAGGTDSEYIECIASLQNNGLTFISKDSLLPYSPTYRYKERTLTPIVLEQNGDVEYTFVNPNAVATMKVQIELYFYNPFNEELRNEDVW